jgi:hypothetical protein
MQILNFGGGMYSNNGKLAKSNYNSGAQERKCERL